MASMQFSRRWSIHDCLDEAYVPFFGAFGIAWDDAMVARWSANPLGMLWPEMDAAFVTSVAEWAAGGGAAAGGHHRRRRGAEAIHRADCCGGIREWCSAMS